MKKIWNTSVGFVILLSTFMTIGACTPMGEPAESGDRQPSAFFVGEGNEIEVISKEFRGRSKTFKLDSNGEIVEVASRTFGTKSKMDSGQSEEPSTDAASTRIEKKPPQISQKLKTKIKRSFNQRTPGETSGRQQTFKRPEESEADPLYNPSDGSPRPPKVKPELGEADSGGPVSTSGAEETSTAGAIPDFLQKCIPSGTGKDERTEFCRNTLDFIANRLIEPHKSEKDVEVKQQYSVGQCNFDADLTLEGGQVVGADNLDGEKLSYLSISNKNNRNHLEMTLVPFRTLIEAANATCDTDVLVISGINIRTLNKLRKNEFHITNTAPFSSFLSLIGRKPESPFAVQPERPVDSAPSTSTRQ